MENLSEEEDNRLEDSPQQQSSASSRSPSPASSAHEEEPVAPRTRRDDPAALNSPVSYSLAVQQRQAPYRASPRPPAKGYAIESVYSILCATDINAIALPPCASHLYTGGADGLVRRYAVHPMLNCSGIAANNLTMKQGGVAPPPDAKFPVLVAYWENEEYGSWANTIKDNVTFGTKNIGIADKVSVVHSLAVQSEELWGLSGTAVCPSLRHIAASITHSLVEWNDQFVHDTTRRRSNSTRLARVDECSGWTSRKRCSLGPHAHRRREISAERSLGSFYSRACTVLFSAWILKIGGNVLKEWDLNTGIALRQYKAHSGQISTIAFRPLTSSLTAPSASTQDDDMDIFANEAPHPSFPVPTSPSLSASSSTGVAASLVSKPIAANGQSTAATPDDAFDPLFDQGSDVDADGDVDDDPSHAPMTQSSLPVIPPPRNVPIVGKTSNLPELSTDVFLSTSIDGQVMIWDRRIKGEGKGGVRKLENTKNAGWCSSVRRSFCVH